MIPSPSSAFSEFDKNRGDSVDDVDRCIVYIKRIALLKVSFQF